jgi:hypothetical protein
MPTYRLGTQTFPADDPALQPALAKAHSKKDRPFCLCRPPDGVEMYIARLPTGGFIIKRMPETAAAHAPDCEIYEPPIELSGLGQLAGTAIAENVADGTTTLKFDFSLTKSGTRAAPAASGAESDSVATDGNKMTLRSVLHYLWEQAGLTRWTPTMAGKRNWTVVFHQVQRAAADKKAKGAALIDALYIPEPFHLDHKDEIAQRRVAQLGRIAANPNGRRKLMLAIGEIKEITKGRFGFRMQLKQVPDIGFMLNEDLYTRLRKRFSAEFALWEAAEDTHLMMIGTFGVDISGVPTFEEMSVMPVDQNWLPFEADYDRMLLEQLVDAGRRFTRSMRYNLPRIQPLATAVLLDAAGGAVALYIVPPTASDDTIEALDQLIAGSEMTSWTWNVAEGEMPGLPGVAG